MVRPEDTVNLRSILARYDPQSYLERITVLLKKYPAISVIICIVFAFYAVPIAMYITFSVGTFILTFVGFLMILGGILLVGFLVLASVLAPITIIIFFVCAITCVMYATYQQLQHRIVEALTVLEEAARRDRNRVNAEL